MSDSTAGRSQTSLKRRIFWRALSAVLIFTAGLFLASGLRSERPLHERAAKVLIFPQANPDRLPYAWLAPDRVLVWSYVSESYGTAKRLTEHTVPEGSARE